MSTNWFSTIICLNGKFIENILNFFQEIIKALQNDWYTRKGVVYKGRPLFRGKDAPHIFKIFPIHFCGQGEGMVKNSFIYDP